MKIIKILEGPVIRPLRKRGQRLGSWTNNFYKPMWLVHLEGATGKRHITWLTKKRLNKIRKWEKENGHIRTDIAGSGDSGL